MFVRRSYLRLEPSSLATAGFSLWTALTRIVSILAVCGAMSYISRRSTPLVSGQNLGVSGEAWRLPQPACLCRLRSEFCQCADAIKDFWVDSSFTRELRQSLPLR